VYLLDTNVWLERVLDQDRSEEVGRLLDQVPSDQLLITDFSFHSIDVVLSRLRRAEELLRFVQELKNMPLSWSASTRILTGRSAAQ
jgi:hypothetical protein